MVCFRGNTLTNPDKRVAFILITNNNAHHKKKQNDMAQQRRRRHHHSFGFFGVDAARTSRGPRICTERRRLPLGVVLGAACFIHLLLRRSDQQVLRSQRGVQILQNTTEFCYPECTRTIFRVTQCVTAGAFPRNLLPRVQEDCFSCYPVCNRGRVPQESVTQSAQGLFFVLPRV